MKDNLIVIDQLVRQQEEIELLRAFIEKLNLECDEYIADNIRLAKQRDELVAVLEQVDKYGSVSFVDELVDAALAKIEGGK